MEIHDILQERKNDVKEGLKERGRAPNMDINHEIFSNLKLAVYLKNMILKTSPAVDHT